MSTPQSEIERHLKILKVILSEAEFRPLQMIGLDEKQALTFFIGVGERMNTYEIFKVILKSKYPEGLPLLPNTTKGATLIDVYPLEYNLARSILAGLGEGR